MTQKILVTFCILLYVVGVPYLEINSTHVFNPDWTPHARIHEVWQLTTNACIGMLCLWFIWVKDRLIYSALLSLFITGGFLFAFAIKGLYGGSMIYLDGSEKTLLGFNIGLIGFGLAVALLLISIFLELRRQNFLTP